MEHREIDQALRGAGGLVQEKARAEKPVKGRRTQEYDFRRPSRFSKEHLRTLQTIHDQFTRNVITTLSTYLRLSVRVQLTSVEQKSFEEYLDELPNPTVVYMLRASPLEGPIVLELNLPPVLAAIDRLCGGPGTAEGHTPQLTEIEQALLQPIGRHIVRAISDAWTASIPLKPTIEETLLNPRGIRAISSNEILALLVFDLAIGDASGSLSLCFPFMTLEPVMGLLHAQVWNLTPHPSDAVATEDELRSRLFHTPLELSAVLGEIEIPTSVLLSLREGQVIRLTTPQEGNLTLLAAGQPLFLCRPGLRKGNLAVQITGTTSAAVAEEQDTTDALAQAVSIASRRRDRGT